MNWKEITLSIGNSFVGVRRTIKYQYLGNLKVVGLSSSCSCSTPAYDKKEKVVSVGFTPKPIPKHLVGKQNFYNTTKYITVTFENGTKTVLTFSTKVIKQ